MYFTKSKMIVAPQSVISKTVQFLRETGNTASTSAIT